MNPFDLGKINEEHEIYKENIIDHYKNPHNFGTLKKFTIKHHESNTLCGDSLEIYLLIKKNKIIDVKFSGHGCALSIAGASMLTDFIIGKSIKDIEKITKEDIFKMFGIPIGIVRTKCALLSLKTVHLALKEIKK